MNESRFNAAIACGAILIASAGNLHAAELRLLAGGAMSGVWAEIKPQFEQASGHKLDIFFGTTPNPVKEATSGKPGAGPEKRVLEAYPQAPRARLSIGHSLQPFAKRLPHRTKDVLGAIKSNAAHKVNLVR